MMFSWFSRTSSSPPTLKFYNTLSKTVEPFVYMVPHKVRMYNCGPTVYGPQHIGNLASAVFADMLRRLFEYNGYSVRQTINITDFGHLTGDNEGDADQGEDRMTKGLKRDGKKVTMENMRDMATQYMNLYFENLKTLNVPLEKIQFPRASDCIPAQIAMIQTLEEKGYAYRGTSGVYFDTKHFSKYGALGGIDLSGLKEGARVHKDEDKHSPTDFLLWKSDERLGWDSPWGKGFPGWHIECSAMARTTLGEQIDVHTGGIEHIAIHHNNEIAQSESATGKSPFSRFWLHRAHVRMNDEKLAKSNGNVAYMAEVIDKGFHPLALRYWFLTSHYRASSNFTWDALAAAQSAFIRLAQAVYDAPEGGSAPAVYAQKIRSHLNNDLDTSGALATVWEAQKDPALSPSEKRAVALEADQVFGLNLSSPDVDLLSRMKSEFGTEVTESELTDEQKKLLKEREVARSEKNFTRSDEIRDTLAQQGLDVKDTKDGQKVLKL